MKDKAKRNRMTNKEAYAVNYWKFLATRIDREIFPLTKYGSPDRTRTCNLVVDTQ